MIEEYWSLFKLLETLYERYYIYYDYYLLMNYLEQ